MMGCSTFDAMTVLFDDPKHDWRDFHQFEMAKIWLSAERDVREKMELAQEQQGIPLRSRLFFMQPHLLAQACPGARCDGIHYGSDYAHVSGCSSTIGVWHPFLWSFLRDSGLPIGSCEGDDLGSQSRQGEARPWPRLSLESLTECLRPIDKY
jgi:hypothetical protein